MISVQTEQTRADTYHDAISWHVDDFGRLHITKASRGNLATYAPGAWLCVYKDEA